MTDQRSAHRAGSPDQEGQRAGDSRDSRDGGPARLSARRYLQAARTAGWPGPPTETARPRVTPACHTDPVRQEILAQRDLHRERREEHDAEDEGGNEQDRYVRRGHQQHQRSESTFGAGAALGAVGVLAGGRRV